MSGLILFSVVLFVPVLFYYSYLAKKLKKYPPGPFGIPIFGNLLSLGTAPHLAFQRYAKIYGSIFSMKLGQERAIVLHGSKTIKEAFADPRLSGRPEFDALSVLVGGGRTGILMSEGHVSVEKRRFALRQLRELGFGKNGMEGLIMDEVNELMEWIRTQHGKPISLKRRFNMAVLNSLWTILCGQRFEHDDPKMIAMLDQGGRAAEEIFGATFKSFLIMFYPKFAKMLPNWSGWNLLLKSMEPLNIIIKTAVDEHKFYLSEGPPRDYVDAYLKESTKITDNNSAFHATNTDEAIKYDMANFFAAGMDTSATTLHWAILLLLSHADIQCKIRNEIDQVVGLSRQPNLADRTSLPYTESFIMELLRYTSIVSWGVPHRALADVEFHGFLIPKGTSIYASLYSSHHDEVVWGDPQNFRPERFLSTDGTKIQKHEALIPFSTGKRVCVGESLGRDQIFLFLTNLVQRFVIEPEEGNLKPTLEVNLGQATLEPYHYLVSMKARL